MLHWDNHDEYEIHKCGCLMIRIKNSRTYIDSSKKNEQEKYRTVPAIPGRDGTLANMILRWQTIGRCQACDLYYVDYL